jgi:putative membrane protein
MGSWSLNFSNTRHPSSTACIMSYRRKIFIVGLFVWYASFSITMAIAPADREFWMAASILPVLLVAGLVVSYRIFPLSSISYFLITLFLTLHAIGVHYTYAEVPFGSWLQQALALDRNHFDRIVHFGFGFLLTYPWEEWFRLFAHVRGWLQYYLPNITILGLSGLWEIVESWFAQSGKAICTRARSRPWERWKVGVSAGVPVRLTSHVVFTRKRYKTVRFLDGYLA